MIVKSLLAVQPGLAHHYRTTLPPGHGSSSCFELLGGDRITILLLLPAAACATSAVRSHLYVPHL